MSALVLGPGNRQNFENTGYPVSVKSNNDEESNPYLKDSHGFTLESQEYKNYIRQGVTYHGVENSYDEAMKFLTISDPKYFQVVSALYTCVHCDLVFKHPKRFLLHYKWHSYGVSKPKENLDNALNESEEENKAEEPLPPDGLLECDICNQLFKNGKALKVHKVRFHSTSKECIICGKTLSSLSHFKAHLQTHNEGGLFPCTMCPKKFKLVHSLQRHVPVHYEQQNYSCQHCAKCYGSAHLLRVHSKVHDKDSLEKNFQCGYCSKTFHQSFRLVAHERTHTGVRPFQCEDCDQSYPTNSSLNRHIKVSHSKDHPFICSLCDKGFHIRSALEHHIRRSHLKERPHQCQDCNSAYSCQSDLVKHRNKAHKELTSSRSASPPKMKKRKLMKRNKKEYSDDSS